jgi:hypothetical protein
VQRKWTYSEKEKGYYVQISLTKGPEWELGEGDDNEEEAPRYRAQSGSLALELALATLQNQRLKLASVASS